MNFQDIYKQIKETITSKNPTPQWIAGTLKRAFEYPRWSRDLTNRRNEINPSMVEDIQNSVKLFDIAYQEKLIDVIRGRFSITPRGSKFVQEMAQKFKQWDNINDLTFKQLRGEIQAAKGEADLEWYDSLSPMEQKMIDLYSHITIKEYHFLVGLKNDKDSKQRYADRVQTLKDSDFESYSLLKELGFINNHDFINSVLMDTFFNTLKKYDYRHLRSFNRSITSKNDRIAADAALARPHDQHPERQEQRSRVLGGRTATFNDRMNKIKSFNRIENNS